MAGLTAEAALLLQLEEPLRRCHTLLAELVVQGLRGMNVDIDPDEVDERARAERPAGAVRHRLVQVLGRDAGLVKDPNAVVQQRNQDPVDDEARCVVAVDRLLAGGFRPVVGGGHSVR